MSIYEQRLQGDLSAIRERVATVGKTVESAFERSIHSVLAGDRAVAADTILADLPINREIRKIDRLCHAFVAQHLPSAGHLRFISSVMRLNIELERIGDYAVAICREQVQLSETPPATVARDIEMIGDQARRMLHQSMKAFNEKNAEMARGTKAMAAQVGDTFEKVLHDLIRAGEQEKRPLKDLFALLVIFNRIGRVADQAKNICEETIFAVTGQTKEPKVYRILFLDQRNDALSLAAEAFARRAFPESGQYASGGWQPAKTIDSHAARFLEKSGFDVEELTPKAYPHVHDELEEFHVIVCLEGDGREQLEELPFHTTLVNWDVGSQPEGLDQQRTEAALAEAFQKISVNVRELMQTLRGEDAA